MKKLISKLFSYQGIRFLFVGVLNTIVGYGIYALLVYLNVNYLVANTISTIIGIAHSYLWSRYFTFRSKQQALKEITKFVSVYAISYVIGMGTLFIFKSVLNISPYIAGLINLVITTLISYFGHKYISFRDNKDDFKLFKNGPSLIEWIALIGILVFCFFSFNHGDIAATATHGKDLLEITLSGKFLQFYDYTESTAVYLIPIYIIFAIWSIPVVIIYKIMNLQLWGVIEYSQVRNILLWWYKLLPTVFAVGTAIVLIKIAKNIGLSKIKQKWIPFLFFSCPLVVFPLLIFGQYDSICMFFTTLAIYFYLKRDYYKFSGIMSLAITFKLFPLFIFIPLILLFEKRIFHIAKHLVIGMLGTVISNVLFMGSPGFTEAKDFTAGMVDRFFMSGINIFSGVLSIFILMFMAVCVYAYMKKIKTDTEYTTNTINICLIIYSSLFAFILWHPQWIIILAPFIILSTILSNNIKTTLILNGAISAGYILLVIYLFPANCDEVLLNLGIFPLIFNHGMHGTSELYNLFTHYSILSNSLFTTLFVSSLGINCFINFPTEKRLIEIDKTIKEEEFNTERGYMLVQILPIFIYILPVLYIFFTK